MCSACTLETLPVVAKRCKKPLQTCIVESDDFRREGEDDGECRMFRILSIHHLTKNSKYKWRGCYQTGSIPRWKHRSTSRMQTSRRVSIVAKFVQGFRPHKFRWNIYHNVSMIAKLRSAKASRWFEDVQASSEWIWILEKCCPDCGDNWQGRIRAGKKVWCKASPHPHEIQTTAAQGRDLRQMRRGSPNGIVWP